MTLLSELQSLLGPSHVLTGADADGYVQDWRRRYRGAALAAVRPGSTDEVAGVVRLCLRHGVPVVPQGGNTGLCGGATPDASGSAVVLSTARLNRVGAGYRQRHHHRRGRLRAAGRPGRGGRGGPAVSAQSRGRGQLHHRRQPGHERRRHAGAALRQYADLALGLEVVTADGEIWNGLRGLRKDNTGYDLRDLYIGSEGTLGIITAATLNCIRARWRPARRCSR